MSGATLYGLRPLPARRHAAAPASGTARLLELQPELLESIATKLTLRDLSSLAATCRGTTLLQSAVIGLRIAELRELTTASHAHLLALIEQIEALPYITGNSNEGEGTAANAVFQAQKQFFGGLAKANGDTRAEDRTGRLLRRVEITSCGRM